MRWSAALFPLLLAIASTALAAEPALPPAAAESARASKAFFHKALVETYDQSGRKNPKWDAPAHELMVLAAEKWTLPLGDPNLDWRIFHLGKQAVAAGCDDPVVNYSYLRSAVLLDSFSRADESRIYKTIDATLADSSYPDFLKFYILNRMAARYWYARSPEAQKAARAILERAYARLPGAIHDGDFLQFYIADSCLDLTALGLFLDGQRSPVVDHISEIMKKAAPDSAIADYFKEANFCAAAWDSRGGGVASTVSDQQADVFEERLEIAHAACDSALVKDPHFSHAAGNMIEAELGFDDKEEMERYFQRAVAEDPDNYMAYDNKLHYLTGKWHGSAKEQWDFGRACLATKRWDSRIPFLLLKSYENLCENRLIEIHPQATSSAVLRKARDKVAREFLEAHPEAWNDIQTLFNGYLALHPDADYDRTDYAELALQCGHADAAQKQLDILGNKVVYAVFETADGLKEFRAAVAKALAEKSAVPTTEAFPNKPRD